MKFKGEKSVLNYGDTSFRRQKYMAEYRILLELLDQHMIGGQTWSKNTKSQSAYYSSVIDNTDLFNRKEVINDQNKSAQRARTLTNSLVKTGLINEERKISSVGEAWLSNNLRTRDKLENILDLSDDNLVFLRQWSKARLYNVAGTHYFVPFLFILNLLSRYDRIPKKDLLVFVHSVDPSFNNEQLNDLITKYGDVSRNVITFNDFYTRYLDSNDSGTMSESVTLLLDHPDIVQEEFNTYFANGKSTASSGPVYLKFVETVKAFQSDPTVEGMQELIKQGKNDKIKKAFGFGKHPFDFSSKHDFTLQEFKDMNEDNALINGELSDIYTVFRSSKRDDLVREYGDMTARLTNLAGVISYENNVASLPLKPVFERLFSESTIAMSGSEPYSDYDLDFNSDFYHDKTLLETVLINNEQADAILRSVAADFGLENPIDIASEVNRQNDERFRQLVQSKFPKNVVLALLKQFINRDDKKISETVTDNAPIADIFEYVLGLSWYYLNGKDINVRKAYKMSLDASFLPLSHAAGYQGDLEFKYPDRTLLLEATLMDRSTQKRGELEPVIRHTANLSIENGSLPTQTIFVASELDDNVMNIFRAAQFIELNHSAQSGSVNGVNIFALNIPELIQLLNANIDDGRIITTINEHQNDQPAVVLNNWRKPILDDIFDL